MPADPLRYARLRDKDSAVIPHALSLNVGLNNNMTVDVRAVERFVPDKSSMFIFLDTYVSYSHVADEDHFYEHEAVFSNFDTPFAIDWPWASNLGAYDGEIVPGKELVIEYAYRSYGNFMPEAEKFYADVSIRPAVAANLDSEPLRLVIALPDGVATSNVDPHLYLVSSSSLFSLKTAAELPFERIDGPHSIELLLKQGVAGQRLLLRVFLPREQFSSPLPSTVYWMALQHVLHEWDGPYALVIWPPVLLLIALLVLWVVWRIVKNRRAGVMNNAGSRVVDDAVQQKVRTALLKAEPGFDFDDFAQRLA
jgi:hypothetical protein